LLDRSPPPPLTLCLLLLFVLFCSSSLFVDDAVDVDVDVVFVVVGDGVECHFFVLELIKDEGRVSSPEEEEEEEEAKEPPEQLLILALLKLLSLERRLSSSSSSLDLSVSGFPIVCVVFSFVELSSAVLSFVALC